MKTLRIILMSLAVVIAVGGAFATTTNGKRLVDQAWGKTSLQTCSQGGTYDLVVPSSGLISDCSGGTATCKVRISGSNYDAYANQTQCAAANPLKFTP